jgi:DNA-binding beta-propeller fold protein YncE
MKNERQARQSGLARFGLPLVIAAVVLGGAWLATREMVWPYFATALALDKKPAAAIEQLSLATTLPLGVVKGRIDHLGIDLGRKRLFVAELGNDSVAVVDLAEGKLTKRLTGLKEPQGVGFSPKSDRLFVANGGDGTVAIFSGGDLDRVGSVALGDDADNIRLDNDGNVVVGYGAGALAVLDPATGGRIANIPLAAHPESFQIESDGGRIFVNEPRALRIGVIDKASGKETAKWGAPGAAANFAMALDAGGRRLFVVYRMPALLAAFDTQTGEIVGKAETCRDADDVFHDAARSRVYVVCGEGAVAVLDAKTLREEGRLQTRAGARTGLYAPVLDLLFVAVPARDGAAAEIRVYRPR